MITSVLNAVSSGMIKRRNKMDEFSLERVFEILTSRVNYADEKHPEGAQLSDLVSEVAEVLEAIEKDDNLHAIHEVYDVMAVCVRILRQIGQE